MFPHLTDLQRKNKSRGLRVVGVTSEQNSSKLKQFVEEMGYGMDYTVAVDAEGDLEQKLSGPAGGGLPKYHTHSVNTNVCNHYSPPIRSSPERWGELHLIRAARGTAPPGALLAPGFPRQREKIGGAHICTPVTMRNQVYRQRHEKKKNSRENRRKGERQ